MSLEIFGFRALWSPYYLIVLCVLVACYFFVTIKYRSYFKQSEVLTKKQSLYFVSAIVLLYVVKGSPIDLLGHIMFYVHMIQMAILYLVIPILFIYGIPPWIWRTVLSLPVIKPLFGFFTKPLIALILFNGVFSFYHVPDIFDIVKTDMWLHAMYTSVLFLLAIFMWWPLVNQLDEYETLNGLKKVGYIFADGILLTPACALIIFADTPMYTTFSDPNAWASALELCVPSTTLAALNLSGPEMFNSMSLLEDQQTGGVLMKVIQEVVYGVILAQVFFSWFKKEQTIDELPSSHTSYQPEPSN